MSLDYWSMKLSGTNVFHRGVFKPIKEMKWAEDMKRSKPFSFPEESLPYIRFRIGDGTTWRSYEDFEIRFPNDCYVLVNGKAVLGVRNMKRTYKLAPSAEHYSISQGLGVTKYLNLTLKQTYDKPESLFVWCQRDRIFSSNLALIKTHSEYQKTVMFGRVQIGVLNRGTNFVKLTADTKALPAYWVKHWGDKVGKKIPAKKLAKKPKEGSIWLDVTGIENLEQKWKIAPNIDALYESSRGCVMFVHGKTLFAGLKRKGRVYITEFRSKDHIMKVYHSGNMSPESARDLLKIYAAIQRGELLT